MSDKDSWLTFVVIILVILLILLLSYGMCNEKRRRKKLAIILPPQKCPSTNPTPAATVKNAESPVRLSQESVENLKSAKEAMKLLSSKKPTCVMFHANGCGHCVAMKPDYMEVAKNLGDKINFSMIEASKMNDIQNTKLPQIRGFPTLITNFGGTLKEHVGRKEKSSLEKLLSNLLLSSNERPKLEILELKSSKEMCKLLESNKKAIVMAYAEWCGHCKAMKADMEQFAKEVQQKDKSVVVARINEKIMVPNECPGVPSISGFPAILDNFNKNGNISLNLGRKNKTQLHNTYHI